MDDYMNSSISNLSSYLVEYYTKEHNKLASKIIFRYNELINKAKELSEVTKDLLINFVLDSVLKEDEKSSLLNIQNDIKSNLLTIQKEEKNVESLVSSYNYLQSSIKKVTLGYYDTILKALNTQNNSSLINSNITFVITNLQKSVYSNVLEARDILFIINSKTFDLYKLKDKINEENNVLSNEYDELVNKYTISHKSLLNNQLDEYSHSISNNELLLKEYTSYLNNKLESNVNNIKDLVKYYYCLNKSLEEISNLVNKVITNQLSLLDSEEAISSLRSSKQKALQLLKDSLNSLDKYYVDSCKLKDELTFLENSYEVVSSNIDKLFEYSSSSKLAIDENEEYTNIILKYETLIDKIDDLKSNEQEYLASIKKLKDGSDSIYYQNISKADKEKYKNEYTKLTELLDSNTSKLTNYEKELNSIINNPRYIKLLNVYNKTKAIEANILELSNKQDKLANMIYEKKELLTSMLPYLEERDNNIKLINELEYDLK